MIQFIIIVILGILVFGYVVYRIYKTITDKDITHGCNGACSMDTHKKHKKL